VGKQCKQTPEGVGEQDSVLEKHTDVGGGVLDGALAVGLVKAVHARLEALGVAAELDLRFEEEVVSVLFWCAGSTVQQCEQSQWKVE
jgi:hypothetical protein